MAIQRLRRLREPSAANSLSADASPVRSNELAAAAAGRSKGLMSGGMRHPLSTPFSGGSSERPISVGDVQRFVVANVLGQAVPEDLEPAVAESPQRGVVPFAFGPLSVVELPRPHRSAQARE